MQAPGTTQDLATSHGHACPVRLGFGSGFGVGLGETRTDLLVTDWTNETASTEFHGMNFVETPNFHENSTTYFDERAPGSAEAQEAVD